MFVIIEQGLGAYKKAMQEYLLKEANEEARSIAESRDEPISIYEPKTDLGWKSRTELILDGMEKALGLTPEEINKTYAEARKLISSQ